MYFDFVAKKNKNKKKHLALFLIKYILFCIQFVNNFLFADTC